MLFLLSATLLFFSVVSTFHRLSIEGFSSMCIFHGIINREASELFCQGTEVKEIARLCGKAARVRMIEW